MAMQITAEILWTIHRAVLGGKSSITGAAIPERLEDCAPGPQAAHYGLALAVAWMRSEPLPAIPSGVTPERAAEVQRVAWQAIIDAALPPMSKE